MIPIFIYGAIVLALVAILLIGDAEGWWFKQ